MWHKMGYLKPTVCDNLYRALTPAERARTREIAAQLAQELPERPDENAFAFIAPFMQPTAECDRPAAAAEPAEIAAGGLRTVYSYFALYGDPLMNPELDPFPERLLAEYTRCGVKGVWLQGLLYQLTEFSFDPSLSAGYKQRQQALRELTERAARYGIGVYLYLNEPRAMNESFFARYPELRGTREGDFWAMCTSQPETKRYLEEAMRSLCAAVPKLAGFFTISMSENLTNCYSRPGDGRLCPHCAARPPEEVVAEVNNLLARGAHAANPNVRAIAWNWAWGETWAAKIPALLSEGQIVQCTSENRLRTEIAGVVGEVHDYSLSQIGPGPVARELWQAAHKAGHETCAKVQFNNTWELSAIPWLPVFEQVARHVANLRELGVQHLQLSWTLGGYPSPVLRMANQLMAGEGDVHSFMRAWLGDDLGEVADHAQAAISAGWREFPFNIGVVYTAPMNYGPQAPFFMQPTGWRATMIGFPYDDLDTWRAIYPREVFAAQLEKVVDGWRTGVNLLKTRLGENPEFDDLATLAEAGLCHLASTWHQIRWVMARDRWLAGEEGARSELRGIIAEERTVVQRIITLRVQDARIGYEASNHYYYTQQDLAEKLVNLAWCDAKLQP